MFPPPPDFTTQSSFPPPPNFDESSSPDLADVNVGSEELIMLAFPNFNNQPSFPPPPDFTANCEGSGVAVFPDVNVKHTGFPPLPDFTSHQEPNFLPLPDFTAGQSNFPPDSDPDATTLAFPLPPDFNTAWEGSNFPAFPTAGQLDPQNCPQNESWFPPPPEFAVSSDFTPLPNFSGMEVNSLEQLTPSSYPDSTTVGVGSSFPPIPDFQADITSPGHRFSELNRGDTPILQLPFDLASQKRAGSTSAVPPKPKKSKTSVQLSKLRAAEKASLIADEGLCRNYRRLGDEREVELDWIQVGLSHPYSKF
jgi:hypothetical protein